MSEELLYQLWVGKAILTHSLHTIDDKSLLIINPGKRNHYSGPDFENAHIRIDGIDLFGSVEIHVKASEWHIHNHHSDKAYSSVILHVVWINDKTIYGIDGSKIPCLLLNQFIRNPSKYIPTTSSLFACKNLIDQVPQNIKDEMKKSCLDLRIKQKVEEVEQIWKDCKKDWEETIYRTIAKSMGFHQNAENMYRLASSIPLKLLWKYRETPFRIEALLFGQAGLLDDFPHPESIDLMKKEYVFLKHKHQLSNEYLEKSNWKYFKMRPQNYPNNRIYELVYLIKSNLSLLTLLLDIQDLANLKLFFEMHVQNKRKAFGEQAFKSLVINGIVPILFVYAKDKMDKSYELKAYSWLRKLKPEGYAIEKEFNEIGLKAETAADSQSFLFWKKNYCAKNLCSSCKIGKLVFLKE